MRHICAKEGEDNMGGYRVTEPTEKLIIKIWLDLKNIHPNPSAPQVMRAVQTYINDNRRNNIFLPSLREFQVILRKARNQQNHLPQEQQVQQRLWSMARLDDYKLPVESLPYIMQVWRYCSHTDEPFTIRQAKWVSRVCHFPLVSESIAKLWSISYMYARKEELSLASQKNHETFLEDVNLVMHGLEQYTYLELNRGHFITDPFLLGRPVNKEYLLIEEAAHPIEHYNAILNGIISNERDKELINKLIDIPALPRLKLNPENEMIYLSWFTHIRKSEHWPKITADQALEVILALRKWSQTQQLIHRATEEPLHLKITRNDDKAHVVSYTDRLPSPDEALRLLSEYAHKGGKQ